MDQLFELKRIALFEQREFEKSLLWCHAHDKLLSIFDDGCSDFFVCHKIWNAVARAQAYKQLGQREACLCALKDVDSLAKYLDKNAKAENYQIGARNPMYFSTMDLPGIQEEYMTVLYFDKLLSGFDSFFENDGQYLDFKRSVTE